MSTGSRPSFSPAKDGDSAVPGRSGGRGEAWSEATKGMAFPAMGCPSPRRRGREWVFSIPARLQATSRRRPTAVVTGKRGRPAKAQACAAGRAIRTRSLAASLVDDDGSSAETASRWTQARLTGLQERHGKGRRRSHKHVVSSVSSWFGFRTNRTSCGASRPDLAPASRPSGVTIAPARGRRSRSLARSVRWPGAARPTRCCPRDP